MFDKNIFAQRVKYFRLKQGYTLQDFAELADISISYLTDIESGKNTPSVDVLISIMNALKIDFSTLMNDTEYEQVLDRNIMNHCSSLSEQELKFFGYILDKLER